MPKAVDRARNAGLVADRIECEQDHHGRRQDQGQRAEHWVVDRICWGCHWFLLLKVVGKRIGVAVGVHYGRSTLGSGGRWTHPRIAEGPASLRGGWHRRTAARMY